MVNCGLMLFKPKCSKIVCIHDLTLKQVSDGKLKTKGKIHTKLVPNLNLFVNINVGLQMQCCCRGPELGSHHACQQHDCL